MRKANPINAKLIELAKGLAIPEYFMPIVSRSIVVGHSAKALIAGDLLRVDYHPEYLELTTQDIEGVIEAAKSKGLRIYRGRKHITISDGVYKVRIFLFKQNISKTITIKIDSYNIRVSIQ